MSTRFSKRTRIAAPRAALYAWHARHGAFDRLAPPDGSVRLVEDSGGVADGARKVLAIGPLRLRWVAVHDRHVEGRGFRDVQESGPFRHFAHEHRFLDDGDEASFLEDEIEYELPLGALGELVAGRAIRRKLEHDFERRHAVTRHDVELVHREPALPGVAVDVCGDARAAAILRAFLAAGGWRLRPAPVGRIDVDAGWALLDRAPLVPFVSATDEELAAVHRALCARLGS
jgi:ligand-binding SRPBCC domain-containing protein